MRIRISIGPCEECKCPHERHIDYDFSTPDADTSDPAIMEQYIRDFLIREGFDLKHPTNTKVQEEKVVLEEAVRTINERKIAEARDKEVVKEKQNQDIPTERTAESTIPSV